MAYKGLTITGLVLGRIVADDPMEGAMMGAVPKGRGSGSCTAMLSSYTTLEWPPLLMSSSAGTPPFIGECQVSAGGVVWPRLSTAAMRVRGCVGSTQLC